MTNMKSGLGLICELVKDDIFHDIQLFADLNISEKYLRRMLSRFSNVQFETVLCWLVSFSDLVVSDSDGPINLETNTRISFLNM